MRQSAEVMMLEFYTNKPKQGEKEKCILKYVMERTN